MAVIRRDLTETEAKRLDSERAAATIVGSEFPNYPLTELADEVVRLRSQLAGAVSVLAQIGKMADADANGTDAQVMASLARAWLADHPAGGQ